MSEITEKLKKQKQKKKTTNTVGDYFYIESLKKS